MEVHRQLQLYYMWDVHQKLRPLFSFFINLSFSPFLSTLAWSLGHDYHIYVFHTDYFLWIHIIYFLLVDTDVNQNLHKTSYSR